MVGASWQGGFGSTTEGWMDCFYASVHNRLEIVKVLSIECDDDIESETNDGETPWI
jgi:hypothetical protein